MKVGKVLTRNLISCVPTRWSVDLKIIIIISNVLPFSLTVNELKSNTYTNVVASFAAFKQIICSWFNEGSVGDLSSFTLYNAKRKFRT